MQVASLRRVVAEKKERMHGSWQVKLDLPRQRRYPLGSGQQPPHRCRQWCHPLGHGRRPTFRGPHRWHGQDGPILRLVRMRHGKEMELGRHRCLRERLKLQHRHLVETTLAIDAEQPITGNVTARWQQRREGVLAEGATSLDIMLETARRNQLFREL